MVHHGEKGRRMTEQPRRTEFTADAFLAWARGATGGDDSNWRAARSWRWRLSASRTPRAKLEAVIALRAAIATSGLGCEAMTDGVSVRIDERTVYEPDALVRCGPRTPGDAMEVTDPIIVVEIVSPSSRGIDTGAKLAGYFQLPSVRHYLIVNTEARVVIHHHRDDTGAISVRILHEGPLSFDPPGLAIEIRDVFANP